MECVITSSKTNFIGNHRLSASCLKPMLLTKVTDTRSCHKGQVTKGQHMKPILLGPCDACLISNFSLSTQWCWLDNHRRRFRLLSGEGQVKVRSRTGKKRQVLKLIFLHEKGIYYSMQLITRNLIVVLVVLYMVGNGKNRVWMFNVINFEQFFCHKFAKNRVTNLKLGMTLAYVALVPLP